MMYRKQRLKPDGPFPGLFVPLILLAIMMILRFLFDIRVSYYALATFFILYAGTTFWGYLQTRSPGILVISLYQFVAGLFCASVPSNLENRGGEPNAVTGLLMVLTFVFLIWVFYMMATKRAKWRGREIFELAAISVDAGEDAFTGRPRPAGTVDVTQRSLVTFAEFVQRHLIAVSYVEENRVVFAPLMMGESFYLFVCPRDYTDRTWVAFDFEGNVTVNISQRDYLAYQEDLSFDQLCVSLANVFIEFYELFSAGRAVRIIDRLNAMPVNIFS